MKKSIANGLLLIALLLHANAYAEQVESFTEPYRSVAVSAAEVGVLAEIRVEEGDRVLKNEIVAKLDDSVLVASLEVARAAKEAQGALLAAEAENNERQKILESYKVLQDQGNASPRECERATNEHLKSSARLTSAREDLEIRRLEYERVKVQIAQRQIKSPISGYVVKVEKEAGEFVSPTDPVVLHVVQLDSLKAIFSIPLDAVRDIQVDQRVTLTVGDPEMKCHGKVEFVSPVADPQSGSIRVKLRIVNPTGRIQSGAVCRWQLSEYETDERLTESKSKSSKR